ncbi:MAG: thiamine biosynthesis protein ThiS [Phycisphaeraceae bacterium]|nr:thiamine biosynthesis protein ThiS [Phycisphaeraceae bacterium]
MNLTINGETRQTQAATVRELLSSMGIAERPVAVEVNRQIVPRRAHEQTELHDGDVIEIVTLVGGG